MREVLHLTAADVRRVPWKNGRGVTEELALWPDNASFERDDFDWRISKAAVKEAGPFSTFADFDRVLVVTEGDGLLLAHGEDAPRARLRRFEPYRFRGAWPTTAELTRGPVADFNVLVRSGRFEADVEVLKLGRRRVRESLTPGDAFVHMLHGPATARIAGEEEPFELDEGDSLWARGLGRAEELDLVGDSDESVALLVRIAPTTSR